MSQDKVIPFPGAGTRESLCHDNLMLPGLLANDAS